MGAYEGRFVSNETLSFRFLFLEKRKILLHDYNKRNAVGSLSNGTLSS